MAVDPAAEENFGPYVIYERLGVGGMATVHRALERHEDGFERMVALKRLLPHLAEDASFIKSFVREAKLAQLLTHVNIVQIYELGRVGTEYFITMEYIDGRDVRQILRHARKVSGAPPIHVTVGLLLQLTEALDYAHTKVDENGEPLRLVHRDISPSNLLVTNAGHLKVIDFGIAKAESSQLRTQTGRVKGKLAYMAPEAIAGGRDLDARCDIWAAGVVLHELLCARPLFASKNEYQTLLKVQRGDIMPPSTFNQGCPPELDAIVLKALARHPDGRFSRAAEMRDELLAVKKQYSLQTGYRDIATWVEWALSLEQPPSFSATGSQDNSSVSAVGSVAGPKSRQAPPQGQRPRNKDEDEAVAMVWGGDDDVSADRGGPVELDEVPDVSARHQAVRADTELAGMLSEDDIPTPVPTHGSSQVYGRAVDIDLKPASDPGLPPRAIDPALARGTDPPLGRGSGNVVAQRGTGGYPTSRGRPSSGYPASKRPSEPIAAQRVTRDRMPAQRTPSDRMPAQPARTTAPGVAVPQQGLPGTPITGPVNMRDSFSAITHDEQTPLPEPLELVPPTDPTGARSFPPPPETSDSLEFALTTNPVAKPLTAEELFGDRDGEETLPPFPDDDAAVTMAGPRHRPSEPPKLMTPPPTAMPSMPVVRFSKSVTVPPANAANALADASRPVPVTKPGVAPAAAGPRPNIAAEVANASARTARALTASRRKPPTEAPPVGQAMVERSKQSSSKAWVLILVALVLGAGGAVAVVIFTRGGGNDTPGTKVTAPAPGAQPAAPVKTTSNVKFVIEPPDSEVMLEGQQPHTGSPWSLEIAPGIYQVEIHHNGYKAWLTALELSAGENETMRVVLEPLGTATDANSASLTIYSTPSGLDAVVDGQVLVNKTPIKTTIKSGPHVISVRQNGVDVWKQNLKAEAQSDYEFNANVTAEKLKERAALQQKPAPAPAPKALPVEPEKLEPPKAPEPAGSGH